MANRRPYGARRLVTFHYNQGYTTTSTISSPDSAALDAHVGTAIDLVPAREGDELEI